MQKLIFIITVFTVLTFSAVSQTTKDKIVFLAQTKTVPGQLEWNREIVARNAGTINIKIRVVEGGKFSVLLLTDEDYQVISRKKTETPNFKPKPLINVDASNSFEKTISLGKGTYWFIIENQETSERTINLFCSEIR